MGYLRRLPLDSEARLVVDHASNLDDLQTRLNQVADATTIVGATQVVSPTIVATPPSPPPPMAEPIAVTPPAHIEPAAALPPLRPPAEPAPQPAPPKRGPPIGLIAGVLGGVALIALLLYLAFGSRGSKDNGLKNLAASTETSATATTPAASATIEASPEATVAPTTAPAATAAITVVTGSSATANSNPTVTSSSERLIDSVLVEALDSTCVDGATGCRLVYSVGPYHFRGSDLRIDFVLQVVTPEGNSVSWIDDLSYSKQQAAQGGHGTQLTGASGKAWPITAAGGIASESNPNLPAGRYTGYWEFTFDEAAGTTLTLDYPDFSDYITIVVPP